MSASCKDTIYISCPVLVERDRSGGSNINGDPHGEYTVEEPCGKDIEVTVTRTLDESVGVIEDNCEDGHVLTGAQEDQVCEKAEEEARKLPYLPYLED